MNIWEFEIRGAKIKIAVPKGSAILSIKPTLPNPTLFVLTSGAEETEVWIIQGFKTKEEIVARDCVYIDSVMVTLGKGRALKEFWHFFRIWEQVG